MPRPRAANVSIASSPPPLSVLPLLFELLLDEPLALLVESALPLAEPLLLGWLMLPLELELPLGWLDVLPLWSVAEPVVPPVWPLVDPVLEPL